MYFHSRAPTHVYSTMSPLSCAFLTPHAMPVLTNTCTGTCGTRMQGKRVYQITDPVTRVPLDLDVIDLSFLASNVNAMRHTHFALNREVRRWREGPQGGRVKVAGVGCAGLGLRSRCAVLCVCVCVCVCVCMCVCVCVCMCVYIWLGADLGYPVGDQGWSCEITGSGALSVVVKAPRSLD